MGSIFRPFICAAPCGVLLAVVGDKQRFVLVAEVAREARVSVSSVRHWLRTGRLVSIRPGRRRLVPREEFERFVEGLASSKSSRSSKR